MSETMDILFVGARFCDGNEVRASVVDVAVGGGKITHIAKAGSLHAGPNTTVIEAGERILAPGFTDLAARMGEPGEEYKEDIASGARSAAAGGFTRVLLQPDTKPVLDSAELVSYIGQRSKTVGLCDVRAAGALSMGGKGEVLGPQAEMKAAGALAISDGGMATQDSRLMRRAMEYARDHDLAILCECHDPGLAQGGVMHEGALSTRLGLHGIARAAETSMVARNLQLAELTGARVHLLRLSCAESVAMLGQAKAKGLDVSGSVAIHNLCLSEDAVSGYDTTVKLMPPLRSEADRKALLAALADGTIDAVVSDHRPQGPAEKDIVFVGAQPGAISLQWVWSLLCGVAEEAGLSIAQRIGLLCGGPYQALFGRPAPVLAEGSDADLVLLDESTSWVLNGSEVASKSRASWFMNKELQGAVHATVFGGTLVYQADQGS